MMSLNIALVSLWSIVPQATVEALVEGMNMETLDVMVDTVDPTVASMTTMLMNRTVTDTTMATIAVTMEREVLEHGGITSPARLITASRAVSAVAPVGSRLL